MSDRALSWKLWANPRQQLRAVQLSSCFPGVFGLMNVRARMQVEGNEFEPL